MNDLTNLEELREDESETIMPVVNGQKRKDDEDAEEDDNSEDKPITLKMLFSSVLNVSSSSLTDRTDRPKLPKWIHRL